MRGQVKGMEAKKSFWNAEWAKMDGEERKGCVALSPYPVMATLPSSAPRECGRCCSGLRSPWGDQRDG